MNIDDASEHRFLDLSSTKWRVMFSTLFGCCVLLIFSNEIISFQNNDVSFTAKWPSSNIPNKRSLNSLPGTTGSGVPTAFKNWLSDTGVPIDEVAKDYYGAYKAVSAREKLCGWDKQTSNFLNKDCTADLAFQSSGVEHDLPTLDPAEVDIVTPSIRDLDFLDKWREFFQGFHIIIIQDGDPNIFLKIPEWVDYELYNRNDIQKALGKNQWIISEKDASIRNFGFLVSTKKFIYTIDDDCLPALDHNGFQINPLALHVRNLKTPSTPYFFNTLYDPYVTGSDFVRGYPYSLRGGVPTAVSHGLWLNAPDYDAATQLLKVTERNTHLVDTTITIPYGTLYPMCSMNVAFNRVLIGPAFMQGLMGVGQPWARYDDMFAGWASKVVADHLSLGVKSGMPYIRHDKASNPFTNLYKEYKGLWWQEHVIRFMVNVKLPSSANKPISAYRALASSIRADLVYLHEYFNRLATAMELWCDAWESADSGSLQFVPSRSHKSQEVPINLGFTSLQKP